MRPEPATLQEEAEGVAADEDMMLAVCLEMIVGGRECFAL
jgi:hypothetical protein